jgi:hypothetical protein
MGCTFPKEDKNHRPADTLQKKNLVSGYDYKLREEVTIDTSERHSSCFNGSSA